MSLPLHLIAPETLSALVPLSLSSAVIVQLEHSETPTYELVSWKAKRQKHSSHFSLCFRSIFGKVVGPKAFGAPARGPIFPVVNPDPGFTYDEHVMSCSSH